GRHAVGAEANRLVGFEDEAAKEDRFTQCGAAVGQRPHIVVAMLARARDDDEMRRVGRGNEQLLLGRRLGKCRRRSGGEQGGENQMAHKYPPSEPAQWQASAQRATAASTNVRWRLQA